MSNLSNSKLDQELIRAKTSAFFSSITVVNETKSTNEDLKRLASELKNGSVLLSEKQTAGKGRNGRTFISNDQKGIYCSIYVTPTFDPNLYLKLSILSGIILCETIRKHTGLIPVLKWPNDILIKGQKVAGILCESSFQSNKHAYFIIGFGLNVHLQTFPDELSEIATTLEEYCSRPLDRNELTIEFLNRFATYYPRLKQLSLEKMAAPYELKTGTPITVHGPKVMYNAIIEGIEDDGQLQIRVEDKVESLISYEITIREDS
ncbi:MAG: BirA family transcriptional regulator biotin operon repressor / biotin-acetyl-CoA-carboxylase ligase [Erysipelotrichaceae bacterium]|nr:MAG: BirA family transcriptional regulator biotin operon repressor / biotin-acetyl-CoA-carboxylase [Erysipelotrichaceae bacterium]TXT17937.1 MAG: BirA family transcriptional regulator biotin operon repressor / biotin-acetyl-CoA-carboxylase ligase [Erysipelotrichaceae bacterium]